MCKTSLLHPRYQHQEKSRIHTCRSSVPALQIVSFLPLLFYKVHFRSIDRHGCINLPSGHCHKAFFQSEARSRTHRQNTLQNHHLIGHRYLHWPFYQGLVLQLQAISYFPSKSDVVIKTHTH